MIPFKSTWFVIDPANFDFPYKYLSVKGMKYSLRLILRTTRDSYVLIAFSQKCLVSQPYSGYMENVVLGQAAVDKTCMKIHFCRVVLKLFRSALLNTK